ncbi:MAG: 6,7-dimethyl-8-ribityllumazine synthase [Tannerellaceae bacterium]|jgi:6,7-dimethyl-8-ribityllumazine synthase|nr:6,7-dimethyl-8-ribityllumazine synthase [Tannerellaceae bacterium]
MATTRLYLSDYKADAVPSTDGMKFGIVVSEWNEEITDKLLAGVCSTLEHHGVQASDIQTLRVPGSFELTYGARLLAEMLELDAIIVLGCVIRGETPHFDYVCSSVTRGITDLNLNYEIPFIFGLLTTDTQSQAEDRAGGIYGNKGEEAAITAIKMAQLNLQIRD